MTNEQLLQYKDNYWAVYSTTVLDTEFIWRGLTRAEFRKALKLFDSDYDREEYICSLCVLEPSLDFANCIAGIPTALAVHILSESGFGESGSEKIGAMLSEFDKEMDHLDNQISCIISEAFGNFTIEEIDNWPLEKTLWYFSRAKYKLSLRGIELTNSKEPSAPEQKQMMQGIEIAAGNLADFPELAQQKAFMAGKLK